MSDSKSRSRFRGIDRRAPSPPPGQERGDEAYAEPLKRGAKMGGRHAAITNDLYNWHSYKNWADKMRTSWNEKK